MISANFFMDFLEHIVNFIEPHALEERKKKGVPVKSSIQQHESGGLSLELLTFRRVVKDSVVDQRFNKAAHPTRLVINLVDFSDLLNT